MPMWNNLYCWGVILSKGALRIIFFFQKNEKGVKANALLLVFICLGMLYNVLPIPKVNDSQRPMCLRLGPIGKSVNL